MGGRLLLALSLASAALAAAAQTPPPFEPAIVEIRLNDQPDGVTLIVRRDLDGALLVKTDDLPQLRLRTPSRGLTTVNGERYLRLDAGIGATVAFDEATQTTTCSANRSTTAPASARSWTSACSVRAAWSRTH